MTATVSNQFLSLHHVTIYPFSLSPHVSLHKINAIIIIIHLQLSSNLTRPLIFLPLFKKHALSCVPRLLTYQTDDALRPD